MKLASIERLTNIRDIPGADRIQMGNVLGYSVVIKRGEFAENDLCVFHHPDTVIDFSNPVYSFLPDARLRVRKFKGQVSQGLALPISVLPSLNPNFRIVDGVPEQTLAS